MHSHNGPDWASAAQIGTALAAVLFFSPRPYYRFIGQPINRLEYYQSNSGMTTRFIPK